MIDQVGILFVYIFYKSPAVILTRYCIPAHLLPVDTSLVLHAPVHQMEC